MKPKKWKHDELLEDLASHLQTNDARMVWCDMQLGPAGSTRPDVLTLDKSYSKFAPVIYEIKVTKTDFHSDVTSGKWMKYLDYASAVVFAVPQGLIGKDELPDRCGLIVRHDNVWRMARKPTPRHLETFDHMCWMKLLIDGVQRERLAARRHNVTDYFMRERVRKNLGDRVAEILADQDRAETMAKYRLDSANRQAEEIITDARKAAASMDDRIRALYEGLNKALGEPESGERAPTAHDVLRLIQRFENTVENRLEALCADAEIARLQKTLDRISDAISEAGKVPQGNRYWRAA